MLARRDALGAGPQPRIRIVCFTDGEDTESEATALDVSKALDEAGCVLDVICVAERKPRELLGLAKISGGYAIAPQSIESGAIAMSMELMLASEQRAPARQGLRGGAAVDGCSWRAALRATAELSRAITPQKRALRSWRPPNCIHPITSAPGTAPRRRRFRYQSGACEATTNNTNEGETAGPGTPSTRTWRRARPSGSEPPRSRHRADS